MARAGYDPHDLANVFKTLEQQGGGGGGFLSDHPSPANRYERINQEAAMLRVQNPIRESAEFVRVQQLLRGMGRAPSSAEIARSGQRYPNQDGNNYPNNNYPSGERVGYPSSRYRTYNAGNLFQLSYPDNWREVGEGSNSIWFAPEGAYGQIQGQAVFTHGFNDCVTQEQSNILRQATYAIIISVALG